MKQINYKKLILPNIPYVFFVYLFDKVGQAVRLAPGADISAKILNITQGFSAAFENALPSVYPLDLLVGIVGAVIIRLIVYVKGKNAKKYRKGAEYGSARWGNAEDIKPYIDPDFQNNIILTQTERLTMNSRPKQPKYARNKNVVVIGGSGSGKSAYAEQCILDFGGTRGFISQRCSHSVRKGRRVLHATGRCARQRSFRRLSVIRI